MDPKISPNHRPPESPVRRPSPMALRRRRRRPCPRPHQRRRPSRRPACASPCPSRTTGFGCGAV
ncbi:MAG: hypothetical protein GC162_12230 [Planctomycetes bacterium]|nr:hypothetical protein [Planctomycetota bacterium]